MGIKCLDTYVLIEIYKGNENFLSYMKSDFVINDLILAEFYGVILREYGKEEAELWADKLARYSVGVDKEILIEAVKFRYENKKMNFSFIDVVGYIFALKKGFVFVTGDKDFEGMKNVEFRKK